MKKKRTAVLKKTIKKLLDMAKDDAPPIKFEEYSPHHFIKYLLSLKTTDDKRLSVASYAGKRASMYHLFRLYGFKQSNKFESDMNVLYKGFKRQVAEEVQNGNGKITTGKCPMSFDLYRQINILMMKEDTTESVWARAFLTLTWNLICRATNTCTVHLHHIEWRTDSLCIFLLI